MYSRTHTTNVPCLTHTSLNTQLKVYTVLHTRMHCKPNFSPKYTDMCTCTHECDPESRYKVICKIIDTERKYLRHLEVLLYGYLPVLKEVSTPRDLRLLFPTQLEPMMERHEDLLSQLEDRVTVESRLSTIIVGDIFAHICNVSSLDPYVFSGVYRL